MIYTPIINTPLDGEPVTNEGIPNDQFQALLESIEQALNPQAFTVAGVPDATTNQNRSILVSNEAGGFTMAYSDGTNWRRVQDRAIIS